MWSACAHIGAYIFRAYNLCGVAEAIRSCHTLTQRILFYMRLAISLSFLRETIDVKRPNRMHQMPPLHRCLLLAAEIELAGEQPQRKEYFTVEWISRQWYHFHAVGQTILCAALSRNVHIGQMHAACENFHYLSMCCHCIAHSNCAFCTCSIYTFLDCKRNDVHTAHVLWVAQRRTSEQHSIILLSAMNSIVPVLVMVP